MVVQITNVLSIQEVECPIQRRRSTHHGREYGGGIRVESLTMVGLTALATLVKGWSDFKKYSFKMDMCRFTYTTYEKTLIELRNHAQTGVDEHQMNSFLIKMQTIDDTVTDITPPTRESYIRDYTKKFRHNAIKAKAHACES